jgi:uncharacterized protein (DUF1015 family)
VALVAVIKPFRAVRYDEGRAGPLERLVAPPYDVIGPKERERYRAQSPYNVVNLTLPDDEAEAARLFAEWQREGILTRDDEPALWWLAQDYVGPDGVRRTREGLAGSVRLEPYAAGVIRPHERTHAGPKEGRLRLLRAVRAQLEPIFLIYDDPGDRVGAVRKAVGEAMEVTADGVTSRIAPITDPAAIDAAREALADAPLLIADGHHRYETALAFHEEDGSEASGFTFAVLVNSRATGLAIFPTHRIAGRLPELDGDLRVTPVSGGPDEALRLLESLTREHPAFVLYREGSAALVEAPDERVLDAALVDRLGPGDVSYTPRTEEAVRLVDEGRAQGAFLLRPPLIEEVEAVAAAGETMPQKSTYFYPKLVSGLLFHPL